MTCHVVRMEENKPRLTYKVTKSHSKSAGRNTSGTFVRLFSSKFKLVNNFKKLLKLQYFKLPSHSLRNLLTPWSRVLLEKLTGSQLVKKFPAFYGSRRFIPASTSARHMSLFWAVRCFLCEHFVTWYFLQWVVVSTSPKPEAEGPPLVGFPRLLIQYIRSYPPYWTPFLLPQSEDAPCHGDRDPLIMALPNTKRNISPSYVLSTDLPSIKTDVS